MKLEQLKGFVAEEVAKYHLEKLSYKVVPIGREKIEPDLSDLLLFIRNTLNHSSPRSEKSFNLFENTISKLPDYLVWKLSPKKSENVLTFRFVEVKYRSSKDVLTPNDGKYHINFEKSSDHENMQVVKYINNLVNLYTVSTAEKEPCSIDDLEFYIYLVAIIDSKHTPLLGKVATSKYSDFYAYFYTPEQITKVPEIANTWSKDYKAIADFIMKDGKLDKLFGNDFLISVLDKPKPEITKRVYEILDGF